MLLFNSDHSRFIERYHPLFQHSPYFSQGSPFNFRIGTLLYIKLPVPHFRKAEVRILRRHGFKHPVFLVPGGEHARAENAVQIRVCCVHAQLNALIKGHQKKGERPRAAGFNDKNSIRVNTGQQGTERSFRAWIPLHRLTDIRQDEVRKGLKICAGGFQRTVNGGADLVVCVRMPGQRREGISAEQPRINALSAACGVENKRQERVAQEKNVRRPRIISDPLAKPVQIIGKRCRCRFRHRSSRVCRLQNRSAKLNILPGVGETASACRLFRRRERRSMISLQIVPQA